MWIIIKGGIIFLDELFTRVSSITKHMLYQYMKDNDISLLNYNFNYFFQHCVQKYQIQVISHNFSNHKIEGLTVIDEQALVFLMRGIILLLSKILPYVMN